jgi:hypothetical protein
MNWEHVLSDAGTGDAAQTAEPAMDSETFAGFYERSARPLWAYLARVSGDPALAEDLMQESYVRFLCASTPKDGEVAARRYLFRIASNLLRDHWRRPGAVSIEELIIFCSGMTGRRGWTHGPRWGRRWPECDLATGNCCGLRTRRTIRIARLRRLRGLG